MNVRRELEDVATELRQAFEVAKARLSETNPNVSPYAVTTHDGSYFLAPILVARAQVLAALAGLPRERVDWGPG